MASHQSDITMAASDHSAAASTAAAAAAARRASGHEEEEEEEDLIASPPSLWLPRTVVRRHRKRATVIWSSLLAFFFSYVAYIVWDTIDSRRNPPASIAIKQEYYKFPDVAVCAAFREGCLSQTTYCFEDVAFKMVGQVGFTDVAEDFDPDGYPEVDAVRAAYPSCAVMPLSRMTVDEAAVKNGDINSFSASFFALWLENPDNDFDTEDFPYHTQLVSVFFIDIDADVESIGEEIVDVKIPYERVNFTAGGSFTATQNHMVLSLTEFSGITRNGEQKEREQTFSQSTTAGRQNWVWSADSASFEAAFLQVEVSISKFEYTSIEEVDPVDGWAIIGAIGGVWQFVVIGFGIFFVFSEKQAPDRKMRNFKKTMAKPATTFSKRLSSTSSRPSQQNGQQDFEIDATDEDLPMEWVKKQTRTGSVYYFNVMTGSRRTRSPNELDGDASGSARAGAAVAPPPPPPPPPRSTAIHNVFRGAHKSPEYRSTGSASQESAYGSSNGRSNHGDPLPPGWIARTDESGKFYYIDTVSKTTQWKRPTMRVHSTGGVGVQAVDTPMVHTRRTSNSSAAPARTPAPVADIPSTSARHRTNTAVHPVADTPSSSLGRPGTEEGGVTGEILPPDWEVRTAPDGKKYYANNITKKTQWKAPKL